MVLVDGFITALQLVCPHHIVFIVLLNCRQMLKLENNKFVLNKLLYIKIRDYKEYVYSEKTKKLSMFHFKN